MSTLCHLISAGAKDTANSSLTSPNICFFSCGLGHMDSSTGDGVAMTSVFKIKPVHAEDILKDQ